MSGTPADLKVLRESLGLSQDFLAQQLGVRDRAVRRWEAGDSPIPAAAFDLLESIEEKTLTLVDRVLLTIGEIEHSDPNLADIELAAYATNEQLWLVHPDFAPLPASWHRSVLARIRAVCDYEVSFNFPADTLSVTNKST